MKTQTILIENEEAWHMLGQLAGLFGDNGGDPDGSAWLPSEPINDPTIVERIQSAGLGRLVEAVYTDEKTILSDLDNVPQLYQLKTALEAEANQKTLRYDDIRRVLETSPLKWAGYDGYSFVIAIPNPT